MKSLGIRWRLVAWVTAVLVAAAAVIFAVVYASTGSQLRGEVDRDVSGDLSQLTQAVRALPAPTPQRLQAELSGYIRAQTFTSSSVLLFAVIPGRATVSNHPEVFEHPRPDSGESVAQQARENALGPRLLSAPLGLSTREVTDVGRVRIKERLVGVDGMSVRLGAGEPLVVVQRAQRSVARSFILAGGIALLLAFIASYLAGASVTRPLRRMARTASRIDDGELHPRMDPPASAGREVRVLADAFNHMLDRLQEAFVAQRSFLADASHELRTPLAVIAGQLEVLTARGQPSMEEITRVQRMVGDEVARTARLVDDMLLLARAERRDFLILEEIALPPFIDDLWDAMAAAHRRRFELATVPDVTLRTDPDRLAQALRNLIRNAVEHTEEPNGLVHLEVTLPSPGTVRFTVADDGPGIPADQRDQIFERFHRTDPGRARTGGGAGLGLAIVRAIAEAHGGSVRAADRAGGPGACFHLDLPGLTAQRSRGGDGERTMVRS